MTASLEPGLDGRGVEAGAGAGAGTGVGTGVGVGVGIGIGTGVGIGVGPEGMLFSRPAPCPPLPLPLQTPRRAETSPFSAPRESFPANPVPFGCHPGRVGTWEGAIEASDSCWLFCWSML